MHRDPVDEGARVLARGPEQHLQLVAEDQHELNLKEHTHCTTDKDILTTVKQSNFY